MSQLLEQLQWRYATKKMDASKVVPQDKVDRIAEAARLAPSSSGLQPYEIVVVSNVDVRARIRAVANDQSQITDGSHLLVFAAWDNYTAERINHMFDLHVNARGAPTKVGKTTETCCLKIILRATYRSILNMPPDKLILDWLPV